jgi:uncharacterized protein with HEPN domain
MARDPRIALEDMLVAIASIAEETDGLTFEQFAANWRTQYIVERALLVVFKASRALRDCAPRSKPSKKISTLSLQNLAHRLVPPALFGPP